MLSVVFVDVVVCVGVLYVVCVCVRIDCNAEDLAGNDTCAAQQRLVFHAVCALLLRPPVASSGIL